MEKENRVHEFRMSGLREGFYTWEGQIAIGGKTGLYDDRCSRDCSSKIEQSRYHEELGKDHEDLGHRS